MVFCTGCSCLCPDIRIENGRVYNACRKGSSIFNEKKRAKPTVNGKETDIETAIERAAEILSSGNVAIYGLDTIPIEAQKLAIGLAEELEAYIDDNSSFCLGDFVEMILRGEIPSTTLDDVKNNAYVIFYWGTDPYNSLSRHLSLYTYYPRGGKRQRGYEEDRFLVVADIRKSHTAKLAKKNARFIRVDDDLKLVESFIQAMEGKAPQYPDVARVLSEMKKGYSVIFGGLGLKYGLNGRYEEFTEMFRRLNEITEVYFIPSGFHSNMRGFNELLFEKTGYINRYSFKEGVSKAEFEFSRLLIEEKIDSALIIGSDPVNSLPFEVSRKLGEINTVVVDPLNSLTSMIADVVIPSALTPIGQGGTMMRSDGVRVKVEPLREEEWTDVKVLTSLKEMV